MSTAALRFVVTACLGAALAAQAKYRLSVDPWIAWAPAVVARQQAMWARHGIDVEVVLYGAADSIAQLRAGRNDFGFVMAGTAVGMHLVDGVDLTVLAEVDWSHGGDQVLVRAGVDLAAKKGARIAVYEDSPAVTMFLDGALRARGLRLADYDVVELLDLESLASQFRAERVDAAVTYEPYSTSLTRQQVGRAIATTADFPGVMPECLVAHTGRLRAIPVADVAALLQGWMDAVAWVQDPRNAREFARLCVEDFFFDEQTRPEQIPAMLARVRIHDRATLRARNLGEHGIAAFLERCGTFARSRYAVPAQRAGSVRLDTRGLKLALGPVTEAEAAAEPPPPAAPGR